VETPVVRPFRRLAAFALLAALAPSARAADAPALPRTAIDGHPLSGRVFDVRAGAEIDPAALADRLAAADVAILGEVHDNPDHHAAQAWLVGRLSPGGIAVEMLPPGVEGRFARLRAAGAAREAVGAALEWEARGWPDWSMYAPIFEAAPDAEITGGAVEPEALREAVRSGAAAAARGALGAAARLYDLEEPLDPVSRAEAAREQVAAHCDAIPESAAAGMVEAQRLRDAAFADAALRARALAGDGRVAVIAGAGHARIDRGVPASLAAARPDLRVAALALVETTPGSEDWRAYAGPEGRAPLFDFLWFTAGVAERGDPCEAFRARRP
jgi:uncharacterized iron-regulated protein